MTPTELDACRWAFDYLFYQDKANACMHCAPVKFSPITFRMAEVLLANWPDPDQDITAELAEVRSHVGVYEQDVGR